MAFCRRSIISIVVILSCVLGVATLSLSQTKKADPPPYNQRPNDYGIYILRNKKFIKLDKKRIEAVDHSYGTGNAGTGIKAMYMQIAKDEKNKFTEYHHGDILTIYLPGADSTSFYITPLSYYPGFTQEGADQTYVTQFPDGWYCGIVGLGNGKNTSTKYQSRSAAGYSRSYHYEEKRIGYDEILHKNKNIVFARISPINPLSHNLYAITQGNFYHRYHTTLDEDLKELPTNGFVLQFQQKNNFIENAKKDEIFRENAEERTIYLTSEKEFTLEEGKILNTGIRIFDDCYIRFISERNFRIVLKHREWDINGFKPFKGDFRENSNKIEGTEFQAHRVQFREFSLRYYDREGTEVRLQGIKGGTKVKVIYSPLYCSHPECSEHTKKAYNFYEKQNDYESAIKEFNTALEIIPNYDVALNGLSWMYATAKNDRYKNPELAFKYAKVLKRIRPEKSGFLDTVSMAYFVNGDLENAIKYEEKAYGGWYNKPKNYKENIKKYKGIKIHLDKANEHSSDEMYEDAIAELTKALQKMPNYVDGLNLMAWLYTTAKDESFRNPELALEYAQKAYKLAPTKAYVIDTLAEAFFVNGDKKNAYEYAKKALYYAPDKSHYVNNLSRFQ